MGILQRSAEVMPIVDEAIKIGAKAVTKSPSLLEFTKEV